ncbi:glycoside hydrolase family 61 protein [Ustulina deusta]|nr:glycoside hydrolase family 61 protein [Ustulina deusta]
MLVSLLSPVALMGAFASTVLAHGNIVWFKSDGITNPGLLWNYWIQAVPAPLTAKVKAGETVTFHYETSTGGGWSHEEGPIFTYVVNCHGSCTAVDYTQLEWVKINAAGYDTASKKWASQSFRANNSTWTTTVPASLAPGTANQPNGAQAYPKGLNIEITGSGTKTPSGTLGTKLYKADDPGFAFNPYKPFTNYPMPGPALFTD